MAEEPTTSEQPGKRSRGIEVPVAAKPKTAPKRKKKRTAKKRTKRTTKKPINGKPIILTAEDILGKQDIKEAELLIEDWDGSVWVRGLSSVDHEKLVSSSMQGPMGARNFNMVGYQAKLTCLCAYDGPMKAGGKRIFTDAHAPMLMEKASGPVSMIATKAQELSGIGGEALKRLRENLGMIPSEGSPTG